ncbi:MAG TPA: preprotein translocase subunit SecY, partial [Planctomycetota bacterium]|nr:preprotein translocase subunit SecY [Planctomycetota bacterium]
MWTAIQNLFRIESLRKKIFVTLGLLFVARVGLHIPLPGVNRDAFKAMVENAFGGGVTAITGLFNALSGGNVNAPVLFSMGILPYISASIIFSLLVKVVPSLEALSKEGASGQKKINQYSRLLTVPLCVVQGTAITMAHFWGMRTETAQVCPNTIGFLITAVLGMTAGTIFLMWLGEQITAHGIGNGVSLLIVAGIVSDLPQAFFAIIKQAAEDRGQILTALVLFGVYFAMVIGIVYMTRAQRRIPMQQAKQMRGNKMMGGQRHYLPIKLNAASVMPVIFASALLTLPATISTWISGRQDGFLAYGGWWWVFLFSALIMFFAFFWTSLMFQPSEMANNLQEYGSFIPGIRPGPKTAAFLEKVMTHITLVGAVMLTLVAIVPMLVTNELGVQAIVSSFMGGTGILIIVGVTLDLVDQLNANLLQRNYEGF